MSARPLPTALGAAACLLSTSALSRLFDGLLWWFGPVLIAVTVAVATAVVSRLLRLPVAAAVLLSLVGLIATVTVLSARSTALLGILPTPSTVETLRGLISDGSSDISRLAAPVPDRPGLVVLTVTGVYLVAMIVDLIVVTLDRPTLAGLPLLALYAVSAAILPHGVGTVPLLLGALSFIALLLVDGRRALDRWGRAVSDRHSRDPHGAGLNVFSGRVATSALGVALAALLIALTVPLGLPSLDGEGLVSREGGGGAGDGPSSASVIQPIVSVSQQLHATTEVPLLRLRTDNPQYLRLTALENFDGQLFTLRALNATRDDRVSEGLPKPETTGDTQTVTASVSISDRFDELYLPVPGLPTKVEGLTGDWRLAGPTRTIFSTRASTANARYRVSSVVPTPTRAQIEAASGPTPSSLEVATKLPASLDPRLRQLLEEVTANARTPYEKVYAIQEHLRSPPFTYDLQGAPTIQEGALSQFLFETHSGYCEQFASAMAVLVRMLGLPARVAIGFVPKQQEADGSYVITNKQAHAWPEVWFPSIGWLGFEPTRRDDGTTSAPPYAPSGANDSELPVPVPGEGAAAEPQVVPEPVPEPDENSAADPEDPAAADNPVREDKPWYHHLAEPIWLVVLWGTALALGLLSMPAIMRARRRRGRLRLGGGDPSYAVALGRVHAAWAEILDLAADLGITIRMSDSPRAGVARLMAYLDAEPDAPVVPRAGAEPGGAEIAGAPGTFADARAALVRLAHAEERARYAPPDRAAPPPAARITEDLVLASRTLWGIAPRGRRVRARIAPASVLRRGGETGVEGAAGRGGRPMTRPDGPAEQPAEAAGPTGRSDHQGHRDASDPRVPTSAGR